MNEDSINFLKGGSMKRLLLSIIGIFSFCLLLSPGQAYSADKATAEEAISLVNKAVDLFNSKGDTVALATINKPDGGFYFKSKALYVFVYDQSVVIVAHPYKPKLIGRSYKGKPDVRGKKFRDEIVSKAMSSGEGWTEYSYQKPGEKGIHKKKAYSKLVDINGKKYIVCAGIYL
jgi:cytochrome c